MGQALIEEFYAAFGRADGAAMAACYGPGARFDDPVFKKLRGEEPGAMWRMLTAEARDLEVELLDCADHGDWATARWRARYVFPETDRQVVNDGFAAFRFADGRIAEHADSYSFHSWAWQALGVRARIPGTLKVVRAAVRRRARKHLHAFMAGGG